MSEQQTAEYGQTPSQRLTDRVQDHEFRIATLAASMSAICEEVRGLCSDVNKVYDKIDAKVDKVFDALDKHAANCVAKTGVEENRKDIVVLKVFNGKLLGMAAATGAVSAAFAGLLIQLIFWKITK